MSAGGSGSRHRQWRLCAGSMRLAGVGRRAGSGHPTRGRREWQELKRSWGRSRRTSVLRPISVSHNMLGRARKQPFAQGYYRSGAGETRPARSGGSGLSASRCKLRPADVTGPATTRSLYRRSLQLAESVRLKTTIKSLSEVSERIHLC
jgi:hypothetical protein